MKSTTLFFILLISILLILSGCEKAECKKDSQCVKEGHKATCINKKCVYEKLCGGKECKGKEQGSKYLENKCINEACISTISAEKTKPSSLVNEQSLAGDRFKITATFNQPFNTRKDYFETRIRLQQKDKANSEHKITRIELTGVTQDRRTVTLAEKQIDRYLWTERSEAVLPILLDFPTTTAEKDGEFIELTLKIYYTYLQTSGAQKQTRENTLQQRYSTNFNAAKPEKPYACPTICPEETEAMKGECSASVGICEYTAVANKCGNFICEPSENKCSCKQDCGPCEGNMGAYTHLDCAPDNRCVGKIKQDLMQTPKTIFDDQNRGQFHLQNNYEYKNPFNVLTDKFNVEINLYQLQQQVTGLKIETIRLLDGTQQIAEVEVNKPLPSIGSKITQEIQLPKQALPEVERNLMIGVWYQFTQNNQVQKGNIQKQLERVTILSPE